VALWNPVTLAGTWHYANFADFGGAPGQHEDLFCGGHTVLDDGRVLAPGSHAVLVRPAITQQTVPCGSAYRLEIAGYDCEVAVQLRSWSGVRRLFR
jgi:hypothetical protein